jgi:hypothetical protein
MQNDLAIKLTFLACYFGGVHVSTGDTKNAVSPETIAIARKTTHPLEIRQQSA